MPKAKTKKKDPKDTVTWLLLIVDRSGSMSAIKDEMQGGIRGTIEEQAKEPGKCYVTLVDFDTEYDPKVVNVLAKSVPPYELVPRGMTALHDATGKAITDLVERHRAAKTKPDTMLVSIITDGMENSSHEWKAEKIKDLIDAQTKEGWLFTFLGANQDAITTAAEMGVTPDHAMTFTASGMHTNSAHMANSTLLATARSVGGAGAQSVSYSGADRSSSVSDEDLKKYGSQGRPKTKR